MQLLVSVRSAAEAEAALAGGAHIIDAKEPDRGSLGAVLPEHLEGIVAAVPDHWPFSVALGDFGMERELVHAVASLRLRPRKGPLFVKCGFAGVGSPAHLGRLLAAAVGAASAHPAHPAVIGVAYADAARARSLAPHAMADAATRAGCFGVLLDTQIKDGRGLLRSMLPLRIADWLASARASGLLTALAGEIGPRDLPTISTLDPDVVGVRGAACEGGRGGAVTARRVEALRRGVSPGTARRYR